jgi:transcriptional regulator with XRE-family HTH domain
MGRPKQEPADSPELGMLGERLRALRMKAGYSNYETFSFDFGLPRAQYGKYEAGRADIRFSSLLRIIRAHGLSPSEFFAEGFEDLAKTNPVLERLIETPEGKIIRTQADADQILELANRIENPEARRLAKMAAGLMIGINKDPEADEKSPDGYTWREVALQIAQSNLDKAEDPSINPAVFIPDQEPSKIRKRRLDLLVPKSKPRKRT